MPLSYNATLVFVLHSGCVGRLTFGRIERNESGGLNVHSPYPSTINEYISGSNLRSWCVFGPDGNPVGDWCSILPEDHRRILPTSTPS